MKSIIFVSITISPIKLMMRYVPTQNTAVLDMFHFTLQCFFRGVKTNHDVIYPLKDINPLNIRVTRDKYGSTLVP